MQHGYTFPFCSPRVTGAGAVFLFRFRKWYHGDTTSTAAAAGGRRVSVKNTREARTDFMSPRSKDGTRSELRRGCSRLRSELDRLVSKKGLG